jgi:hypothetical protein
MRGSGVLGAILIIWLIVGGVAAWQRNYFAGTDMTCAKGADIALTVVAGPLNYTSVNPDVTCTLPAPKQ